MPTPHQPTNASKLKKKQLSYDDLPTGTKVTFKKKVIPFSLDFTATLEPWAILDDKKIMEIWNRVFGESDHQIEDDDYLCDNFTVAKTLVSTFNAV